MFQNPPPDNLPSAADQAALKDRLGLLVPALQPMDGRSTLAGCEGEALSEAVASGLTTGQDREPG